MNTNHKHSSDDNSAYRLVAPIVERAREAQRRFEQYDQQQVDEVVLAAAWALMEPTRNEELSQLAVATTGLGKVSDKIAKNHRKTLGLLANLEGKRTVGIVSEDPSTGIVEISRPIGVVGAVVPSTNPAATPTNKTINALKGRNAIVLAPSPKGYAVCERLVNYMQDELARIGAPRDLVQLLPDPVTKASTHALMQLVDLIVVTGSQNNVRSAYSSGTPAIGVGAGNVPVIIDESANIADAARKILASKTFDNATSCSSENSLVILDSVYDSMVSALQEHAAVLLTEQEKRILEGRMWTDGNLSRDVIARDAGSIASTVGLDRPACLDASILLVEESGIGADYPFSGEKLSPVLTLYRARDFEDAFAITRELLEYQGKGHSCGIHSTTDEHIEKLGLEMPVCRVIVNQAHAFGNGGNFDNALPFSLSMGCGSWGKNSISDNMNYRHYLNTTRIVRTIEASPPLPQDLFSGFFDKHGIANPF
ncbi:aldehyde dehydrogenase family protein [Halomonas sp. H10-59]|uniref:Aldehyde dehydrogenase family protein n=1 Tax=Halomonas sp. H10-59 TaxID=2950874 RepID=A0AAU7KXL0_9GAMM